MQLVKNNGGYQLLRDGKPFLVQGAGGDGPLPLLARTGANSVRTWGADHLDKLLDEAQGQGLSVTVGIWLGHERHGFNYNDADQVAAQYEQVRQVITRYKDHPAVLLWGLGNEMEGYGAGDNAAIWSAINNLAILAKKIDPNHPTMTVVAEIGGERVKNLHRLCPDIDIAGINSYAGIDSLQQRYKDAGGTKPYLVTEFGPPGMWETQKNGWGTVPELTSTEKAQRYRSAWQSITAAKGLCLGGYAFTWGNKQEATATWFGMLLPDGTRLGAVDALTQLWSGKPPANRCPLIEKLSIDQPASGEISQPEATKGDGPQSSTGQYEQGATIHATLQASDPENDPLQVRFVLQRETLAFGVGGDAEEVPPTFPEAILKSDSKQAELRLPDAGGDYRLYAYVRDNHGGAAVANLPLNVKGPAPTVKPAQANLPLVIYDDSDKEKPPYIPAGWMGNAKALKVDRECADNPHTGMTCMKFEYRDPEGWAGVVWQSPAGDWGDKPGGWNLTGAKRLVFWARGAHGDETVSFEFGLLGGDKAYPDTGHGKLADVTLTSDWREYAIELGSEDLSRIKTGFSFVLKGQNKPVTFYLDDIRFE